jgi:hypothetical protein
MEQGHEVLGALKEAVTLQSRHILDTLKEDPSKLHRTAILTLDRLVRIYLNLRKLYGSDTKEVKIEIVEVE